MESEITGCEITEEKMASISVTSHTNNKTIAAILHDERINNIKKCFKEQLDLPLWVLSKNKVPHQINGQCAKCNDTSTWTTFHNIISYCDFENTYPAIAVHENLIFIDLDNVVVDGTVSEDIARFIKPVTFIFAKKI